MGEAGKDIDTGAGVDVIAVALDVAVAAGLKIPEFLALTPFLLSQYLAAKRKDDQRKYEWEYSLAMSTAWHTAAFTRIKKMPPLEKILKGVSDPDKNEKMTLEGFVAKIEEINRLWGGDDKRKKK